MSVPSEMEIVFDHLGSGQASNYYPGDGKASDSQGAPQEYVQSRDGSSLKNLDKGNVRRDDDL